VVYVAEQTEPVRRRVALKVIKLGMDTKAGHRPLRGRAPGAGDDGPSQHRQGARCRGDRAGRPYFVMELVRGIRSPTTATRTTCHHRGSTCSSRSARPSSTPTKRHHPPRHQALEHPGHAARRRAGAQGDRLRHRQGDRRAADRRDVYTAVAPVHRHPGLHEPGAGGDERAGHRHPQRHLQPGRAALRTAHRQHAVRCEGTDGLRHRRDAPTIREQEPQRPEHRLATCGAEELTTTAKAPPTEPRLCTSFAATSTGS
jgi:hypothetical protein